MNFIVVAVLAFAAIAASAPVENEPVKIVRSEFDAQPNGNYVYGFESDDGISKQETGEVKEVLDEENKPHSVVVTRGSFQYKDSEGVLHALSYVADESGYHPQSDDLPKEPIVAARR